MSIKFLLLGGGYFGFWGLKKFKVSKKRGRKSDFGSQKSIKKSPNTDFDSQRF